MATQDSDMYNGVWYCWHWYPSKDDSGEDMTKNRMRVQRRGDELILTSEPNEEHSYMHVELSVHDGLATGSWHETSSPTGNFKGAMYSGAGQLIVSDDRQSMEGMWAGVGYDHEAGKQRVYTGRWALSRKEDTYDGS